MARVFVSHASQDSAWAGQLHQWLVAEDHEVFLDTDPHDGIVVGEDWDERLHERLRWADAVVCVVTSAAVASTWCTAEVSIALSRGSRLLPVRVEREVNHPLLKSAQYADLATDSNAGRAALMAALRQVDAAGGSGWPDDRSPFPGLRAFEVEDHRVFFGRSAEVEQLAELLRSPAERAEGSVLLVVGPSGCGKSSLVRAGLLHVIANEPAWWTLSPMLPGADPVVALARELAVAARRSNLDWTVDYVHGQLAEHGLVRVVDELLLTTRARRLLVVVDQFEELITVASPQQRARFAQLLGPALGGPLQVVAPLRSEFLGKLLLDSDLAMLPTHTYTLRPLRREALSMVIEGPARQAGIAVADDLVARLVGDTDSGEALPLLAFTLSQLAEGISRGGQLSRPHYERLGGVQGALARQADLALADAMAATGRPREEVIAGLLQMVTVDEQGRPTRWRIPRAQLSKPTIQELGAFISRRLVTTDTERGEVVVGVAHEACLHAWPPLAQAIEQNVSALRARRAVEHAADEWEKQNRPAARLWERGQLAAALAETGARIQAREVASDRVELSTAARDFLRASIHRDRLRRGQAIIVLSVLLILAVVAAAIAVVAQRATARERNVAVSQRVAAQALGLRASNPALAAQLALAAYRLTPTADARGSLLSTVANPDAIRLTGHSSYVKGVAVSPAGQTLATGSNDKTVRLWDTSIPHQPHPLSTLTGHTSYVPSVAFSPDGHILASASDDSTTRLWDVRDPHQPNLLSILTGHAGVVYSVAFSPDGYTLATAHEDKAARLWDIRDPHHASLLATLTGHDSNLSSVAFSPDGHTLATASHDPTMRLWDIRDPHHASLLATLTGHSGGVSSVAFSPDGNTLASGSYDDRTARLWDIRDPHQARLLATLTGHSGGVNSVTYSPDGRTLATAGQDTTARLWKVDNPSQPSLLETLAGHTDIVYSVAFSPDGHNLVTGSYDNTARLWSLSGPIIDSHTQTVSSVAFSPDGHTLATASYDRTARLWDIHEPRQPHPIATLTDHTGAVSSAAFSPDGHMLATTSFDKTARLWDVHEPIQPHLLATLTDHTSGVFWVAFSPDGRTLATASQDTTTRLWDIRNPRQPGLLDTLTNHIDTVYSTAFSPDGHNLTTASGDHTTRLWNVDDPAHPRPLSTLTGHSSAVNSVAFSPDGHTLATASSDNTLRLWDTSDPHQTHPIGPLSGHTSSVNGAAFSPDGHTLATASSDNTARLWDIHDLRHPSLLGALTGHTSSVKSVAFSPDGHTLATASTDGTARLWEINIDRVVDRICKTTPTITPREWNQYLPDLPYQPPCPRAT